MDQQKNTPLQENKMGTMPVGKLLASMAIPMMISMLVQALYNVVDSIYVSQLSENALNSVSLAFPLQNLMIAMGAGTGVGMNALLSRSLGAKDQESVDRSANTGLLLYFLCAIIFALVGIFVTKPFFMSQTDVKEIYEGGISYASICLIGSVGIFFQFASERLLQSTGLTRLAMWTQLTGALINIILDPILIFGWFGLPALGVAGAAWATIAGQIIAAILGIFFNIKFNKEITLSFKKIRWHKETVKEIYRVGLPSIVMQSIGSVMTFCLNKILIEFTTTATAVFGAYFKLQSFIFMPIFGLNSGMVPIISYNLGARKLDRIKKTIKLSIITAVCIMSVGVLLFETIPHILLGFFNASEDMLKIGTVALRNIAPHFILAGFCIISGSVFQAIGNPVHALINSVCRQIVVLIPAAWLLSKTGILDLVWLSFPIAELMSLLMSSIFLVKTLRTITAALSEPNLGTSEILQEID